MCAAGAAGPGRVQGPWIAPGNVRTAAGPTGAPHPLPPPPPRGCVLRAQFCLTTPQNLLRGGGGANPLWSPGGNNEVLQKEVLIWAIFGTQPFGLLGSRPPPPPAPPLPSATLWLRGIPFLTGGGGTGGSPPSPPPSLWGMGPRSRPVKGRLMSSPAPHGRSAPQRPLGRVAVPKLHGFGAASVPHPVLRHPPGGGGSCGSPNVPPPPFWMLSRKFCVLLPERGGYSAGWNFCLTNSVRNFCAQFVRCF